MSIAAATDIVHRDDHPGTLYYDLHCHWCDRRTGTGHEIFCRNGRRIDWQRLRTFVFMRDHWRCRYCEWMPADEDELHRLHVDHVRPRSDGGRDVPWNLVTACWRCNGSKGAHIRSWLPRWEAERADYEAAVEAAYLAENGVYG